MPVASSVCTTESSASSAASPSADGAGGPSTRGDHGRDGGEVDAEHPGERARRQIHDRVPPYATVLSLLSGRG